MITATPDGRRLRIRVIQDAADTAADSGVDDILVAPLSAKRGVQLSRLYVAQALGTVTDLGVELPGPEALESTFIEAVGPDNYGRIGGAIVAPTDPNSDLFKQGVRFRAYENYDGVDAPDGDPLRHEEIQQILQAAFFWQSVVGVEGVNAYLENTDLRQGKALGLLLQGLGIQLSRTSRSGESEPQTQQAGTPDTSTQTGTSSSVVLPPAASSTDPSPRTPTDHLPRKNHPRRNSGRD